MHPFKNKFLMDLNVINELFLSEKRQIVDAELKKIVNKYVSSSQLRDNILYHLCLDKDISPTLEHSKRLRPYLCLLFAEEAGHKIVDIVPLAVTVELLHNSTLIVDDIQDNSSMRCGKLALWKKEGLADALNASYFLGLFSQQYFDLQKQKYGYFDYSELFADTTDSLISGQQLDINANAIENKNLNSYCEIAKGKTGALLNLCFHLGSMPYNYNQQTSVLVKEFADLFSYAYQILDDLNDLQKYLSSDNIELDSSNIFYFTSNNSILTKQKVSELIPTIITIQDTMMTKLKSSYSLLRDKQLVKTNILLDIINTIVTKNN